MSLATGDKQHVKRALAPRDAWMVDDLRKRAGAP
jgi:hypothetical protein